MTRIITLAIFALPLAVLVGCGPTDNDCQSEDCNGNGTVDTGEYSVETLGQCARKVYTSGIETGWNCQFTVLAPEGVELDLISTQLYDSGYFIQCEDATKCTMTLGHGTTRLDAEDEEYLLVGATPGATSNFQLSISEDFQFTMWWQGVQSAVLCDVSADEPCMIDPWNFEGSYAVQFDKTCTDLSNDDQVRIYTAFDDFAAGDGLVHLWGAPSTDALTTNREIGGEDSPDYFTGYISDANDYVLFQQWTEDDELWREKEYTCP